MLVSNSMIFVKDTNLYIYFIICFSLFLTNNPNKQLITAVLLGFLMYYIYTYIKRNEEMMVEKNIDRVRVFHEIVDKIDKANDIPKNVKEAILLDNKLVNAIIEFNSYRYTDIQAHDNVIKYLLYFYFISMLVLKNKQLAHMTIELVDLRLTIVRILYSFYVKSSKLLNDNKFRSVLKQVQLSLFHIEKIVKKKHALHTNGNLWNDTKDEVYSKIVFGTAL